MTISELRFRSPGLGFYIQGPVLSAIGIALIASGVVIMAIEPWNWAHAIYIVSGVFVVAVGLAFTLFVWFLYVLGTVATWREWRQLRPPAVVIDGSGVRYLAGRRPVLVPWPDIEQVCLERTVFRHRVVTQASLRLAPGAGLLCDRVTNLRASSSLNIGTFSRLTVPESLAVPFLAETAGTRLEITETDRRAPARRLRPR